MKFSIEMLRIAANAAHRFPAGYDRTISFQGYPCPAHAMDLGGFGYHFSEMCELVWSAAGCPMDFHDKWDRVSEPPSRSWFQTMLSDDPSFIGKMFDTIIFCASECRPECRPSEAFTLEESLVS